MPESSYYMKLAEKASESEQLSQFGVAAEQWFQASEVALSKDNRYWAIYRNQYCQHQLASLLKEECEHDNAKPTATFFYYRPHSQSD